MAYLDSVWIHNDDLAKPCITAYAKLKPAGEVKLKVDLPPKFHAALLQIAQTAIDAHEAQMRAEILGDAEIIGGGA